MGRRKGRANPLDHCALNVALYGAGGKRWAMTERGRAALTRDADHLQIGPSALEWDGIKLTVRIDETTVPIPSRITGEVRIYPGSLVGESFTLDAAGRHRWSPMSPSAHVEVALDRPGLRWSGTGYLDGNDGDEPLEQSISHWHWSRVALRDGTAILYDVVGRDGQERSLALHLDRTGRLSSFTPPPPVELPRTLWRIARATRADDGQPVQVRETLEDAPFYARSLLETRLLGETAPAFQESLSLDRFDRMWVQMLLPFRMPRF